ncbi:MAG: hypothetical protein ACYYK0_06330 [Candidatus Eutrophobiaceae bacterium]
MTKTTYQNANLSKLCCRLEGELCILEGHQSVYQCQRHAGDNGAIRLWRDQLLSLLAGLDTPTAAQPFMQYLIADNTHSQQRKLLVTKATY